MNIILETKFGSHLYGLDTPNSDTDIKGIFLPTIDELLLGNYPKSIKHTTGKANQKNTKDDIDSEFYSLPYFIKLCMEGNTTALDMLHSTESSTIKTSDVWEDLKSKRRMFYTSSMQSLVGYARHQAGRYGLKGTRMAALESAILPVKSIDSDVFTLGAIAEHLYLDEFCFIKLEVSDKEQPYYSVCGKKYPLTIKVKEFVTRLETTLKQFGDRAKAAKDNEGVDFKALSHATRAAYQMKAIYEDGDFEYPLRQTYFLKQIKLGEVTFNELKPVLESLLERVEELAKISNLPKHADKEYWDQWLLSVYKGEL